MTNDLLEACLVLLAFIVFQLFLIMIWVWIHSINRKMDKLFDPRTPVNAYGESFTDAIQESIVRGQRGISQYDR